MGKIYAVGIGPGNAGQMYLPYVGKKITKLLSLKEDMDFEIYRVKKELEESELKGKEFITTPMTQEVRRCQIAFEQAQCGKNVAMVCSGDAGVYGMAGLLLELSEDHPDTEIQVVPGITAALSGAGGGGGPGPHRRVQRRGAAGRAPDPRLRGHQPQ